jgi:hypothetical protein
MNTGFGLSFDYDSSDAWLGRFSDSAFQQFVRPETLQWIMAIVVCIWILAFVVATISEFSGGQPETGGQRAAAGRTAEVGDTCAWLCPWRPSPWPATYRRRGPLAVS